MQNVLVLGTTGMLGSMVYDYLQKDPGLRVTGTSREGGTGLRPLDAEAEDVPDLSGQQWVVNCIGVIKPFIKDDNRDQVIRAIRVNSLFPTRLAVAAERNGARVLQIATDCVYSGRDGCYDERAAHDATDVYGKTKSMGEVHSPNMSHLRCSIIGPEAKGFVSLLSWFLKQPDGSELNGFRNHLWNGVTTLHFAKLCAGIIKTSPALPHAQHVIPSGDITKADLLRAFGREYGRHNVRVKDVDAPTVIDRRLRTADEATNRALWRAAGHAEPPTVEDMVHEMAAYAKAG